MALQDNVESIVMLTSLVENNKVKCHEYFPKLNGLIRFANVSVTCKCEEVRPTYIKRVLEVEKVCWIAKSPDVTRLMFNYDAGRREACSETLLLHLVARPWRSFRYSGSNRVLQNRSQREEAAGWNHHRSLQVRMHKDLRLF
jgi:Protein-tyrosine phosphatase